EAAARVRPRRSKTGTSGKAVPFWGTAGMFAVEVYAAVRHFVFIEGNSRRECGARFRTEPRDGVEDVLVLAAARLYSNQAGGEAEARGPLLPVIDAILETDRAAPVKQRHTAKRIFEQLRAEHEYIGGLTVVKDYVRIARDRLRETFVPLSHPPGQVDFG